MATAAPSLTSIARPRTGAASSLRCKRRSKPFFKDRSDYYATTPIRQQAPKGKWDYHLENVYTIGILNFEFPNNEYAPDSYRHEIKLKDVEDHHVFYDKLTFIYLEMPKFNKTENELETMFDKWMFVLRNLSRLMERPVALQDRVFKKLFEQAEIAKYSVEERRQYEASQKEYWDYTSTLETAELKGEKKGEKKGLIKGEKKKAIDVAQKMKADGLPVETIAKYTELSPDQIQKL